MDEQGVVLRATWRLDRGFINLSTWQDDRCTATFHLTPADAAQLMSFLARGLADATSVATMAPVRALPDPPAATEPVAPPPDRTEQLVEQVKETTLAARSRLGRGLEALAARVTPR